MKCLCIDQQFLLVGEGIPMIELKLAKASPPFPCSDIAYTALQLTLKVLPRPPLICLDVSIDDFSPCLVHINDNVAHKPEFLFSSITAKPPEKKIP